MDYPSLTAVLGSVGAAMVLMFTVIRMLVSFFKVKADVKRKEDELKKVRSDHESMTNVAKIALIVSGGSEITPDIIKLSKQLYYGVLIDPCSSEIIPDFETKLEELLKRKTDVLSAEIRSNSLIHIAGITSE